jgi:hypothetical protein
MNMMQIENSANSQLRDLQQKVAVLLEESDSDNILLAERQENASRAWRLQTIRNSGL